MNYRKINIHSNSNIDKHFGKLQIQTNEKVEK